MIAIYSLTAAAIVLWGAAYLFRGSLIHGCLAFLLVGFCAGHEFLHFPLGSMPMTLDRLVLAGLLAAYAVQRRLGRTDPKPLGWVDVALGLLAVVLIASTFTHDWRLDATRKVSPVWRLVAGFLMPMVLYWIARQSPLTPAALRSIYGVLAMLGVYLAFTALAEAGQCWALVFPKHIADPRVGIHFGRARGPTLNAQSLGLHLNLCLLCAGMWGRSLPRAARLLLVLALPAWLAAIYFTYTRCVWLGLVLGLLVLAAAAVRGRWRVALVGSAVIAGALLAAINWDNLVGLRREAGAAAARSSVDQRGSFTYVSWKMFLDHPWFGVGYTQFTQAVRPYLSDRDTPQQLELIRNQPNHDTFLAMLTETGLAGFGLYVAVLAGWARAAWQLWRSEQHPVWARLHGLWMLAALATVLSPALFFDLTYSPQDHWVLFFLAGVTVGLRRARCPEPAALPDSVAVPAGGYCFSTP
jgi:O-antigen ligase